MHLNWWFVPAMIWGAGVLIMIGECRQAFPTWPYANGLYQLITTPIAALYRRLP